MAHHPAAELEFREFVANRYAALRRTAYLLVGDWAHAEDVVQLALTSTYLAWPRIADRDAVEPYVRRVLVNTVTSWWRKRWHAERPTGTLPEPAGTPDPAVAHADRDLLWSLVKRLPVRQRAVLVLRYYEDLTEAETARLLGVSLGTVKSQCSRAIATLRRQLGSRFAVPDQNTGSLSSGPGSPTASGYPLSSGATGRSASPTAASEHPPSHRIGYGPAVTMSSRRAWERRRSVMAAATRSRSAAMRARLSEQVGAMVVPSSRRQGRTSAMVAVDRPAPSRQRMRATTSGASGP